MNVDSSAGTFFVCREPVAQTAEDPEPDGSAECSENYLRAREQAERAAAKAATTAIARGIHQQLAQLYAMRAGRADGA